MTIPVIVFVILAPIVTTILPYYIAFYTPPYNYREYTCTIDSSVEYFRKNIPTYTFRIDSVRDRVEILDTSGRWFSSWRLASDIEKERCANFMKKHPGLKSNQEKFF